MKSYKDSLALLAILLLASCGGTTNSQGGAATNSSNNTNNNESTNNSLTNNSVGTSSSLKYSTNSSSNSKVENDSKISLHMMGDLYLDATRTIYAIVEEGYESDIIWETSDKTVVVASPRQDLTTECSLIARKYGTVVITATLADYPEHKATMEITIAEGEVMPEDLFNRITGSVKLTSDDQCFSYDKDFNETLDEEYLIETIYEDRVKDDDVTDGYQLIVTNKKTGKEEYNKKFVRGLGGYAANEYLNIKNEIESKKYTSEDYEDGVKWTSSFYNNLWGNPEVVTNEVFRTFDGGKTYHYASSYLSSMYLSASMYLLDMAPDDLYFTYDNDELELHVIVDPYNKDETEEVTYGRHIITRLSEIGTATIEHPEVFKHEDTHDKIDAAKAAIVDGKNYTVSYTLDYPHDGDDVQYDFIITKDTIHQVITNSQGVKQELGAHKTGDNSYFEYKIDDNNQVQLVKQHNTPWDNEDINRYPTFDFASEIFEETSPNNYVTRGTLGTFVNECLFLPSSFYFYDFRETGTLTLDDNGNLKSISAVAWAIDEELRITAYFSNVGTTICDIDFSNIGESNQPSSFLESSTYVYNDLVRWNIEDVLPFLYCKPNYASVAHRWKSDNETVDHVFVKTNKFDLVEDREAFIEDYKALLLGLGYTDTGVDHEETGFRLYEKGNYKIGVGSEINSWNQQASGAVKIILVSDDLVFPNN